MTAGGREGQGSGAGEVGQGTWQGGGPCWGASGGRPLAAAVQKSAPAARPPPARPNTGRTALAHSCCCSRARQTRLSRRPTQTPGPARWEGLCEYIQSAVCGTKMGCGIKRNVGSDGRLPSQRTRRVAAPAGPHAGPRRGPECCTSQLRVQPARANTQTAAPVHTPGRPQRGGAACARRTWPNDLLRQARAV